ncbi:MAG: NUDIX hydrolase [bacterium]|nr:NUDIX hydrolase [bacterium]
MKPGIKQYFIYCPYCRTALQEKNIEGKNRLSCDACGFVYWNNPKPAVSVILSKNQDILLLQRSQEPFPGYWVLPGGYIEEDEEPAEAIIRETKEETGLDIVIEGVVQIYLVREDPRGSSIDIVYRGKILGGMLETTEHSQYRFFPRENLPEMIAYKHREAIEESYLL